VIGHDADDNLRREGIPDARIARIGNVMIDTLLLHLPRARALGVPERMGLVPGGYAVATLHRPSNVDDPEALTALLGALAGVASRIPVVFPVHPRTRARLSGEAARHAEALRLLEPLGYLEFLSLTSAARLVLTDSGGLQEEATVLGVPCLTLRDRTERPITIAEGTNEVVGTDPDRIAAAADRVLHGDARRGRRPALWDGRAGERAADAILALRC
jgi:UDP-N-acetylglucosamine 2-epimerase (non-hydrolysing)